MEWYPYESSIVLYIAPLAIIATAFAVLFALLFALPAPYGRYQNTAFGAIIPARVRHLLP